jgi:hypothetical protein
MRTTSQMPTPSLDLSCELSSKKINPLFKRSLKCPYTSLLATNTLQPKHTFRVTTCHSWSVPRDCHRLLIRRLQKGCAPN